MRSYYYKFVEQCELCVENCDQRELVLIIPCIYKDIFINFYWNKLYILENLMLKDVEFYFF